MQAGALFQAVVHGLVVGGIFEKLTAFDSPADPGQVLKDHPASADVGVAHLAVSHLPGGQTHIQPGGGEGGVGIVGKEAVQHRGVGQHKQRCPGPGAPMPKPSIIISTVGALFITISSLFHLLSLGWPH